MIYRIQKKDNGYMIQQSPEGRELWRMAEKTGLYKHRGSAGSRVRQLRHEALGMPDELSHRIMRSVRFCEVEM